MKREPIAPVYLDMEAAAQYSSLSVRTLRSILKEPGAPPAIRLGGHGKILIHRPDLDAYFARHKAGGADALDTVVDEVMEGLKPGRKNGNN